MTPEKQRIAIAEACGWRVISVHQGLSLPENLEAWTQDGRCCRFKKDIPDYLNDLNAMHEAENMLTDEEYAVFTLWLGPLTKIREREYISAPAAERAAAFLRAKGLYERPTQ